MIARIWSARATASKASAYTDHFSKDVLPEIRKVPGYAGATVLQHENADGVEIVVLTRWTSLEAIREFAGDPIDRAVVTAEAAGLLDRYDEHVRHYRIAFDERASAP